MSRSVGFALQLAATVVGALLDFLVGKLTGAFSWGIVCWAGVVVLTAAILESGKDLAHDWNKAGSSLSGRATGPDFIRRITSYRWTTVVNALLAAAFAALAVYAFTLAVITLRFVTVYHGSRLGAHSPFNHAVVTFVSNFQVSASTAALIVGSFVLAILLRSEILLPFGIGLVAIANALLMGLPGHNATASGFHSQIAYSVSAPDGWLFRLPVTAVPPACLIPIAIGMICCTIVSALVRN